MSSKKMNDELLIKYCDEFNEIHAQQKQLSDLELMSIRVGRASKIREAMSPRDVMCSNNADLILQMRYEKSRYKDGNWRHMPVSVYGKKYNLSNGGFIFNNNKWEIEHSIDYALRSAYNQSPSLEMILRDKELLGHNRLNSEFCRRYSGKFGSVNRLDCWIMAVDRDDLRVGPKPDAIFRTGNNVYTKLEFCNRCVLSSDVVIRRTKQLENILGIGGQKLKINKIIWAAVAWSEKAEKLIKENKSNLYTPVFFNGDISFKKII